MSAPRPARIPVTLIGGYLGAGKTSLLNHLLTHAGGERFAVLVNDFGALGLDAALVARRDAETVTLTNGCVCCSIADDFGAALDAQVRAAAPPERIVVETSGVAELGKTARYIDGWPGARLDAVLTVVDLETVRVQARDRFVGGLVLRQVESADLVVANKSDRVEAPARRTTLEWLGSRAPGAALIETRHGRVAPAIVLGVGPRAPEPPLSRAEPGTGLRDIADAGRGDRAPAAGAPPDPPFVRLTCRSRAPCEGAALAAALNRLPRTLVRFKGIVRLRDRPERPQVLQGVGRRWSLEPAPPGVPALLGVDDASAVDFLGVGPPESLRSALRDVMRVLECRDSAGRRCRD